MPAKAIAVTDAELAVLDALWRAGTGTIRELAAAVYQRATPSACATVQKLLERLEAKGCVRRDKRPPAHAFSPAVTRGELIGRSLETLADKLCAGSLAPLLVHLTERVSLSKPERAALRKLIAEN